MKKLGTIRLNPERIIKNTELLTFKGGDSGVCFMCKDCEGYDLGCAFGSSELTQGERVLVCQQTVDPMTCDTNECPCSACY